MSAIVADVIAQTEVSSGCAAASWCISKSSTSAIVPATCAISAQGDTLLDRLRFLIKRVRTTIWSVTPSIRVRPFSKSLTLFKRVPPFSKECRPSQNKRVAPFPENGVAPCPKGLTLPKRVPPCPKGCHPSRKEPGQLFPGRKGCHPSQNGRKYTRQRSIRTSCHKTALGMCATATISRSGTVPPTGKPAIS